MSVSVPSIGTVRTGTCPHGLSPGACPICSGMSGGTKIKTADFTAKPGEMSWNECAAIGAFLKSLRNAQMAREVDYQRHLINVAKFESDMAKAVENLNRFIQTMNQNVLTKPLAVLTQKIFVPILKGIQNLPVNVLTVIANVSAKLADISDKLTAIYGEFKAAVNKKISDLSKKIKKKLKSLFELFNADNDSDENEIMTAFEKKLNQLKSLLEKISDKLKEEEYNDIDET